MANDRTKTEIITEYVAAHPDATWKVAAPDLEPLGINQNYFGSMRSRLKTQYAESLAAEGDEPASAPARRSSKKRKKPGRKKGSSVAAATPTPAAKTNLTDAADFARKAGGLNKAKALLEELGRVQV